MLEFWNDEMMKRQKTGVTEIPQAAFGGLRVCDRVKRL